MKKNANLRPLVSVIMSVFNENPEFLIEAIHSILAQTYTNFEFIIIDDGSDEECKRILHDFSLFDSRIRIITNISNIGLTKSLNKGIEVSQGKYIARMDSDDFSLPMRIELQVQYMEKHNDVIVLGTDTCDFSCRKLCSLSRTK